MLSLNDDDDDAKALPTGVPKDDAMKKGGWGGQNVSKSDGVILVCSLNNIANASHFRRFESFFYTLPDQYF